jgi:hypothetical protein
MDDHDRLVRALLVERYRLSPRRPDTPTSSLAELDAAISQTKSRENATDRTATRTARRRRQA